MNPSALVNAWVTPRGAEEQAGWLEHPDGDVGFDVGLDRLLR